MRGFISFFKTGSSVIMIPKLFLALKIYNQMFILIVSAMYVTFPTSLIVPD
jgi:hypothetical protein